MNIMKNWKTTLGAIVLGALGILQTTLTAYQDGKPIQWLQVAMCVVVMAIGLVIKDFNVTGAGPTAMTAKEVSKVASISLLALLLGGCGGTLHTQIEKVIVFEQQVHTYQMQLQGVAEAAIVMLPIEKQQAAREALVDATEKLSLALDAKDAALQAALDASDTANLNVNQLVADIVSAVNAVVAVVNSFGANARQTQAIGARLIVAQTRAMAR